MGGPVCLEMVSVTTLLSLPQIPPPSPYHHHHHHYTPFFLFLAFSKHKLRDETGEVLTEGLILQSDKKSWLTRTLPVSIDQCRMKPCKKFNRRIQMIGYGPL